MRIIGLFLLLMVLLIFAVSIVSSLIKIGWQLLSINISLLILAIIIFVLFL